MQQYSLLLNEKSTFTGWFDDNIEDDGKSSPSVLRSEAYVLCDVLQAGAKGSVGYKGEGNNLLAVVLTAVEYGDVERTRRAGLHHSEVKTVCVDAQTITDADGKLAQEAFLRTDARTRERHRHMLPSVSVDHYATFLKLTALAAWIEAEADLCRVAR